MSTLTDARRAMLNIKNGCEDIDAELVIIDEYLETLPAVMITLRELERGTEGGELIQVAA